MKEKKYKHNPTNSKQTKNRDRLLAVLLFLTVPLTSQAASFNYQLLEDFPGVSGMKKGTTYTDLLGMVSALYKFGIWTVGIAALLMLVIGGFMYMTSAGNTSRVASAKGVIGDALLGLLAALGAFLLLYVINPDLTKLNLKLIQVNVQGGGSGGGGNVNGGGGGGGAGNGNCTPVSSGSCSEASLKGGCFASQATQASSICNKESGGNPGQASNTDKCKDGNSFSYGLFQINLTVHNIGGLNCPAAFSGKNYSCTVVNQSLYNQCVAAASDPAKNLQAACGIYNSGGWNQWGANKGSGGCGF